ncbi:MAG: endonuclease/exonuclease/phosphatase family protein [Paludibacter sp.]|nr:endonuclease/exonuclease/phosphatase family protein [Paludibacter sp.]
MKQKLIIAFLLFTVVFIIVLIACQSQKKTSQISEIKNNDTVIINKNDKILNIATFNIQNLGKSKLSKPEIMDTLVAIVRYFDIVAVQEISDVTNQTADKFLELINNNESIKYQMACSNRTGRQANDQSSREQYAFYYNPTKVQLMDTALFDDREHDYFQREPFTAQFKNNKSGSVFLISTIHTSPDFAVEEIDALKYVALWFPKRFKNAENIILCGDFNASCTYASSDELDQLAIRKQPYYWIIPDDANTNLSKNQCAYDRFVVNQPLFSKIKSWKVYQYFKSKKVSDHWPVYIEISL